MPRNPSVGLVLLCFRFFLFFSHLNDHGECQTNVLFKGSGVDAPFLSLRKLRVYGPCKQRLPSCHPALCNHSILESQSGCGQIVGRHPSYSAVGSRRKMGPVRSQIQFFESFQFRLCYACCNAHNSRSCMLRVLVSDSSM